MRLQRLTAMATVVALLSACGGGGDNAGTGAPTAPPTAAPTPVPTPTPATSCSLRARQNWAAAQLREWYLFPETLPSSLDPTPYTSVGDYVDALTATARSQRRDRFFTYVTSIAEENAFFDSGSSAGFGIRLATDATQQRLFVTESFEGAPALAFGIDRGTEITAIGTNPGDMRTISSIVAANGLDGITTALGPDNPGVTRRLRFVNRAGSRELDVTKADFALLPISSRYGVEILENGARRAGYINLRTFISTADPTLRSAFANFRVQGVTDLIIDLRYNGGGLLSTAALMANLMGRNRFSSDVFAFVTYRASKSGENSTYSFIPQPESIAPTRIAFIGGGGTASASELLINGFVPYLDDRAALIGSNTFGKPVGQIAIDRPECDDRLRPVAFVTQNSVRSPDYYDGLATIVKASCRGNDDISRPMGDPAEGLTRQALDFLAGRSCTPIGGITSQSLGEGVRNLITPDRPSTAQREVPGLF